ncbi:MAG: cyclase family protein [Bacteroidetes bacterium]|nr:cyclase family protein [Bacteroidota bacterium]
MTIFQVKDEHQITLKEIKSFLIRSGDLIIFKTKNSDIDWISEPFNKNYISLDTDAAVYLSEIGISCIGVDYLSVAQFDHAAEVHRTLLEKKILIIEGLILFNVIPGKYEMICLPLKIKDADGAPARVLLKKINIR